jgi:PTH1 family peptidyl-tRNA hydrolase
MLVVGLGNPGERYLGSPHNVGFRVLDSLLGELSSCVRGASMGGSGGWSRRFNADLARANIDAEELVLLKPLTFMNRSGESVREAMSFFKITEDSTLVVHDELDLPLGSLKLKRGGGEAGHNGLKSVSAELGTRDYCRLRVGVGRPATGEVSDFLLAPLSPAETLALAPCINAACDAIGLWVRQGLERAMNAINRQPAPSCPPEAGRPD